MTDWQRVAYGMADVAREREIAEATLRNRRAALGCRVECAECKVYMCPSHALYLFATAINEPPKEPVK